MSPRSSRLATQAEVDAIETIATDWVLRARELTPAEQAAFAQWREADPRHEAAATRIEATDALLQKLPFVSDELLSTAGAPKKKSRFASLRAVGLAVAAALVVAFTGWQILTPRPPADFTVRYTTSAVADFQRITLPDGSVLKLNAASSVNVQFLAHERRITLLSGEAHFDVAKNPARPFVVHAGSVEVRAVGTAFNVRQAKSEIEVIVTEGKVQIGHIDAAKDATVPNHVADAALLVAGEQASIPLAPSITARISPLDDTALQATLSWQNPRLIFSDTPLARVVTQFNRYNALQVALADPALGSRPVVGNFRADNVDGLLRLFEVSGELHVDRTDPAHVILRPATGK